MNQNSFLDLALDIMVQEGMNYPLIKIDFGGVTLYAESGMSASELRAAFDSGARVGYGDIGRLLDLPPKDLSPEDIIWSP